MMDLFSEYQRECERRAHRPSSIEARMRLLRRTQRAINKPFIEATVADLRGYLDSKKLHPRTTYAYISHWSAFFTWAILEGFAVSDPTIRIVRPKVRVGLPRPFSTDQLAHIIDSAPGRDLRAMLFLAGHAGLRCMEIAGLDGPDVLENHVPPTLIVADGKGGKTRAIPMGHELVDALRSHGVPWSGPVFRKPDGHRYPAWSISHILRTHMHDCGVNGSAHQLRHTFATAVYRRSNGDLRMTQELLGHSNPSTTAVYTAWSQDRAALVVDDLYGGTATVPS